MENRVWSFYDTPSWDIFKYNWLNIIDFSHILYADTQFVSEYKISEQIRKVDDTEFKYSQYLSMHVQTL